MWTIGARSWWQVLGGVLIGAALMAASTAAVKSEDAAKLALPVSKPVTAVVVNMVHGFDLLAEKVDADADLKKQFQARGDELNAMNADLAATKLRIDKMALGEEKQRQQAELDLQSANYTGKRQKFSKDMELAMIGTTEKLYGKMLVAVEELRVAGGYDMVLMDDQVGIGASLNMQALQMQVYSRKVLAKDPRLDMTAALVTYMNDQYKAVKSGR